MVGIDTLARVIAGGILLWAALHKAASRDGQRLAPYAFPPSLRAPAYWLLAATEAALGILLLVGVPVAPFATLGLGGIFIAALFSARLRGVRRLDCGCFGAKERSVEFLLARAVGFVALAALAAFPFDAGSPTRDTVVLVALVALAVSVVVLGALVLALYRQVGILTLRVGPGVALELAEEGPPLGEQAPLLEGLRRTGPELAVFFSPGCRLCRQLAPAVRALGREGIDVRVVYENEDAQTFERWAVPGTPFAVHVLDGIVAAKGTVNTLEQLEQLITVGTERVEFAPA
jgi:uncharacterized membrane protein YphA (DoxX/SURF4 family)